MQKRPARKKKKKKKAPKDIYLGEAVTVVALRSKRYLCIASVPPFRSVYLDGSSAGSTVHYCCSLLAVLLPRQCGKARGYGLCWQCCDSFLTAVLASATSWLTTVDVDRRLFLLLRLLSVDDALLDVACKAEEGLLDVDVRFRADFHEGDAELVGKGLTLLGGNGALLFPVTLVANKDLVDALGRVLLNVGKPCADVCERRKSILVLAK